MGVRAKFHISGVELLPGKDAGVKVTAQAVSRGDRNANWSKATPSGNLTMIVNNPPAADWFVQLIETSRRTGKYPELFIDIEAASDGYPGDGHRFREADVPDDNYIKGNCGECGLPKDPPREGEQPYHPNG